MIESQSQPTEPSIELLKKQDREAFAQLVDYASAPIYRLALRMLNDEQDAEDVLQETFIKAYQALPGFEGRSSLKTWLFRIATNEALMLLRKRKPQQAVMEIDREEDAVEEPKEIVDWCCVPEPELMSVETRKKLEEAASHLSPGLRAVFLLRDVEGLSGEETASILNGSVDVVKTRLLRARLKLREELSVYFGERLSHD
jgi:RNA polymerase sigma-70 factor (ECF subfamily)